MNPMVRWKLALFVIGLILWAWGYRTDDSYFRVAGIVVLLIAFLLRFVRRRAPAAEARKDDVSSP
ncbi:MAG TPA: hypothetical protein VJ802_18250 [Gemmatimonadaceae bacterium]|nr:hypothetical protein [Gemmatimonadaceae bacterium]